MERRILISTVMQMIEGLVHIGEQMNTEDQIRLQDYLIMTLVNIIEEITNN